ncbi:hypothetical protein HAU32_09290 [Weissella confusa]|jgi:hypothetical protein|uniref:DUF58 domain-containing protein n=1 Tax=Weissella fermenti TaxID=2987699 RepID=A0ABT6D6P2_9LACO|nr:MULTISPECIES: hypothetical protein [Weissella]MBJ7689158.1 hypothetical protein [Weissella confusa]MCW0927884.1 hypothetical protein [Weissella sp. LMG 11983]MDF9300818.1 hypothetical protein [Weissella sp. BK2]
MPEITLPSLWFGLEPAVFVAIAIPTITTVWHFISWWLAKRPSIIAEFTSIGPMDLPLHEPKRDPETGQEIIEKEIQIKNVGSTMIWVKSFNVYNAETNELVSPENVKKIYSNIPLYSERTLRYRLPFNPQHKFRVEIVYTLGANSWLKRKKNVFLDGYMLGFVSPDYPHIPLR